MSNRPNFLLITTDQQRFDTINALGNGGIFTPHLNWLVETGVAFDRCYADCPVCVPSRATIMSGRHGYNLGITGNSNSLTPLATTATLPGLLTQAGYQTRAQGKMHFSPMRCHYGFEEMELPHDYFRERRRLHLASGAKEHGIGENEIEPVIGTGDETTSLTRWTVDRSIDFLETRDESRPFFMWTSFTKPHPPWDPSLKFWSLYDGIDSGSPVEGDWDSPDGRALPFFRPTRVLNNAKHFSPQQKAAARRAYFATITEVDYSLGLLFARMRELGLLGNTWIIFTADHGEMLGDHGMFAKSVFFEGSAHVPLIARPPDGWQDGNVKTGTRKSDLVCLADLLPTVLDLAGVEIPDLVDGAPLFGSTGRERLFGQCEEFHAVVEGHMKYLWCKNGGVELLFDLAADPKEERDLAILGTHNAQLTRLRQALIGDLQRRGSELVREGKLVSGPGPMPDDPKGRWPGFHSTTVPSDVLH